MTLRRKLLIAFGGLATTTLLIAMVALYMSLRWQTTSNEVETHYRRSLYLEQIRAETFQALSEVHDRLAGGRGEIPDARQDFERAIVPTRAVFAKWDRLATTAREKRDLETVKTAHESLIGAARDVFVLAGQGRRADAVRRVDDRLDTGDYAAFRALTERIAQADQVRGQAIRDETRKLRRSANVMAAVAILAALSLSLLIAAYLASDLFGPLRQLGKALDGLAAGDTTERLDQDRKDEVGAVARAYNRTAEAMALREAAAHDGGARDATSDGLYRLTVHRLVDTLESRIASLRTSEGMEETLMEVERIMRSIGRVTQIGHPLDLHLEPCDPCRLSQAALKRFGPEIAARGISCELDLEADARSILVDRLKLRGALEELIRSGLAMLPDRGGRIGVRVRSDQKDDMVLIEIADNGRGMDSETVERALSVAPSGDAGAPDALDVGTAMVRALTERHGGTFALLSKPGQGIVARLSLPVRQ